MEPSFLRSTRGLPLTTVWSAPGKAGSKATFRIASAKALTDAPAACPIPRAAPATSRNACWYAFNCALVPALPVFSSTSWSSVGAKVPSYSGFSGGCSSSSGCAWGSRLGPRRTYSSDSWGFARRRWRRVLLSVLFIIRPSYGDDEAVTVDLDVHVVEVNGP